jgi:predicted AAA+ superfamily ATPase
MIKRSREMQTLPGLLSRYRVVAIIGTRQVGKTTLARSLVRQTRGPSTFFDLA